MKTQVSILGICLLAAALTACSLDSPSGASATASARSSPVSVVAQAPVIPPSESPERLSTLPTEPVVRRATLLAVGDIMSHMPQLPGYYNAKSQNYDFTPWFAQVKPILEKGDWVIGNLETPIAGKDLKFTGFPRFNAPDELAFAIKQSGIQLVSTANNHSLDRGVPGVRRTLGTVRKAGLIPVGTSVSLTDRSRKVIEERNGIRLGFLAYTYGTNGIPLPADSAYAVNLIDPDTIKRDIASLRQAGAEAVVVSLHFGVEYQRMPNAEQKQLVRELVKAGADIVLGSHPHVVQPYEEIDVPASESEDGTAKKGIAIYSLGNFISNQTGNWKDVGLIFGVQLTKTVHPDGTSDIRWEKITTTPTWVHIVWNNKVRYYTIIPMQAAIQNRNIPGLTANDYTKMKTMLNGINKHLLQLRAG
ncbi:CapA family protein [Cohnella terricola]|nr:CapA family protein [Cohnella terricola]